MSLHYHPGKANIIVDALSRLSMGVYLMLRRKKKIGEGYSSAGQFRSSLFGI